MRKQLTQLLFLAGLLIFSVSCNTTQTDGDTVTGDDSGETVTPDPKPVMPQTSGVSMKGDNYEIVVLNDSIKSPRKELRGSLSGADITINYGSPAVNGRELYGGLVPYGKVWRTGANEAVRITTSAPLKFGKEGKTVPAGTYGLFTIPDDRDNWTIIFNKEADQWGAYDYSEAADVARVTTTSRTEDDFSERMDFTLSEDSLELHWGDLVIPVQVSAATPESN